MDVLVGRPVVFVVAVFAFVGQSGATDVPFTSHAVATAFDGARCVRPADIDADGDVDLVAAASSGDVIAWFENSGDGSSWVAHTIEAGTWVDGANSLGVADIDRDGDLDVFGSAGTANGIRWWENDGTPASGPWTGYWLEGPTLDAPNWVEWGDLDGDGDPDVVGAVTGDDAIMWWENDDPTGGWWTQHTINNTSDGAWSANITDLDGDGDLDVLTAAIFDNTIAWFESDGTPQDGGWLPRIVTSGFSDAHSARSADLDGDGDLDVIGVSLSGDTVAWWENDGTPADGGWTEHIVDTTFDLAYDVDATDVDGDGDLDILGAASLDAEITWWENDGTPADGGWKERVVTTTFSGAASVCSADLDGDGDTDLVGAARVGDAISWWRNETIHRTAAYPRPAGFLIDSSFSGEWQGAIGVADLDGDGDLDVAAVDPGAGDIVWWENGVTLAGGTWTGHSVAGGTAPGANALDAHDIDGDGDQDLAVVHESITTRWWENDGTPANGGWTLHDTGNVIGATDIQVVDINGSGLPDLLIRSGSIVGFLENGFPSAGSWFYNPLPQPIFDSPPSVADIDRDGLIDVLGAGEHATSHWMIWYRNIGRSSPYPAYPYEWSIQPVAEIAPLATSLADLDRDGDLDILALMSSSVSWWENDGTPLDGGWIEHLVGNQGVSTIGAIRAADLDADGDLDLMATASDAGDLVWWESDGTPADGGWAQHVVDDDAAGVLTALAVDLDRDGDLDVLGAAATADDLLWWQNRGGQFRLETGDLSPGSLADGERAAIFEIEAFHSGRTGDHDEEVASFALLFESAPGIPMSSAEAGAVVDSLLVYLDNGDGVWVDGVDTLIRATSTLGLVDGVEVLPFQDGSSHCQLLPGSTKRYFVVITAEGDASMQSPNTLVMTHLTDGFANASTSTAEDRQYDIPLSLQWSSDETSVTMSFPFLDPIFADDFELGNASAWASEYP